MMEGWIVGTKSYGGGFVLWHECGASSPCFARAVASSIDIFHAQASRGDGLMFASHMVLYAFPPAGVLMSLLSRVHRLGLRCVVCQ